MCGDFRWDDEVDVVCTDAGLAGLALAVAAVDHGGEVLVAQQPTAAAAGGASHWFDPAVNDEATASYFAELAADIDLSRLSAGDARLPVRSVHDPGVGPARRTVPPFDGARLRNWAAACIASPSGYVYTRVTDWPSTTMDTDDGDALEVVDLGAWSDARDDHASALAWLGAQARERDIPMEPVDALTGLVFEDGTAVGAVFTTPDGPLAVRARHGVLICRALADAGTDEQDRSPRHRPGRSQGEPIRPGRTARRAIRLTGRLRSARRCGLWPTVTPSPRWRSGATAESPGRGGIRAAAA